MRDEDDAGSVSLATVWRDAAVKRALMTDPRATLRRLGIVIPPDIAVKALGSRGAPTDPLDTLVQIVVEHGPRFTYFFIPSPLHPSAQQAAYGRHVGTAVDAPVFDRRMRADAAAALRELGVPMTGQSLEDRPRQRQPATAGRDQS